jgi:hypothetical protein
MYASGWKALAVVATSLVAISAVAAADAPTREIVEKVMKQKWDKERSTSTPRSELTLNDVRFGKPYSATAQEVQVEGIPKGATVTPMVVDFTVRTYYTTETQAVQRVREATVYKDKMDDWSIMTGSPKGQDKTTKEAAK